MTAIRIVFLVLLASSVFTFAGPVEAQTATPYQRETVALFLELVDLINADVFALDEYGNTPAFAVGNPLAHNWLERVDDHVENVPNYRELCFDISPFDRRVRYTG